LETELENTPQIEQKNGHGVEMMSAAGYYWDLAAANGGDAQVAADWLVELDDHDPGTDKQCGSFFLCLMDPNQKQILRLFVHLLVMAYVTRCPTGIRPTFDHE